jgi:hypothetical protein
MIQGSSVPFRVGFLVAPSLMFGAVEVVVFGVFFLRGFILGLRIEAGVVSRVLDFFVRWEL